MDTVRLRPITIMALSLGAVLPAGRAALASVRHTAGMVARTLEADTLHPPPDAPLGTQRPPDGTTRYAILMRAASDSAFHSVATMVVQQTTLHVGRALAIRRVATYTYVNGSHVVDTTLSLAGSLAPLMERTHKPSDRIVAYDFNGRIVTGRMGPVASPKAIHDTLPEPAFNSTDLELAIESLRLRDGLRASLPIYDPELGGFRHATLHVTGRERVATPTGPRRAWVIEVRDNALDFHYRIDQATRAMLAKDMTNTANGRVVRLRSLD